MNGCDLPSNMGTNHSASETNRNLTTKEHLTVYTRGCKWEKRICVTRFLFPFIFSIYGTRLVSTKTMYKRVTKYTPRSHHGAETDTIPEGVHIVGSLLQERANKRCSPSQKLPHRSQAKLSVFVARTSEERRQHDRPNKIEFGGPRRTNSTHIPVLFRVEVVRRFHQGQILQKSVSLQRCKRIDPPKPAR